MTHTTQQTNPSPTPETNVPAAPVSTPNGKAPAQTPGSARHLILAADQVARENLTVPEWGGVTVECRGITLGQRSQIMRDGYTNEDKPRVLYDVFYPLLLIFGLYDPDGSPVFRNTPDDRAIINERLSPDVVDRIGRVIMRLSGMGKEDAPKNGGAASPSGITASASRSS